jgi:sodium-dependent dicarboxylate transporter 2/3/5
MAHLLPGTLFSTDAAMAMGIMFWMCCWWITLPVEPGITALIPIVVNAFFKLVPMDTLLHSYATETFYLLLGADLIALSWEATGLDKRIALKSLCIIGPSLKQQVVVWFTVSALLSSFLPNIVVCAMLTRIAVSMLKYIMKKEFITTKAGMIILLVIAWGTGVGGLGSPLGGAMNLVAIDYIQNLTGREFLYAAWMLRLFPVLLVLLILNVICLLIIRPKKVELKGTHEYFSNLYADLRPAGRDEKISFVLFLTAIAFSFLRPLYMDMFPELKPAIVFMLCGLLTFVLPKKTGGPLLTWGFAQGKIFWGLILMFGGGIALGILMNDTGATRSIGGIISKINVVGGFSTILIVVVITMILAEISSNTFAAAISLPIVISITQGAALNPIPYIYITIVAFNCAFMLPTSIRAIPVGFGIEPKYMLKNGFFLFLVNSLVISGLGYLLLRFWRLFSTI